MPQPDPIPTRAEQRAIAWRRYRRLMVWMAFVSLAASLLAIIYLRSIGQPTPLPVILTAIGGIGVSVLLGTALMGLVFLSNNAGIDDMADRGDDRER